MSAVNQDAKDVAGALGRLFSVPDGAIERGLRDLFVERLDFERESGAVALNEQGLPGSAFRIAGQQGVHVLMLQLTDEHQVAAAKVRAALRAIRGQLGGDVLLAVTDGQRSQWHFVYPGEQGGRETLRRMVLHRGQPHRTVAEQLAGLYRGAPTDLRAALEQAYNVEAVTKNFFRTYKAIFDRVMDLMQSGLPDDAERKPFCQMLFNRLMFLYFLQRKGWMTFGGSEQYFEALWADARRKNDGNFYDTRLRPLFFVALSHARSTNDTRAIAILQRKIGKVPFLNGGLFEEGELDRRPGVTVPDEAIRLILQELFAKFNFTIAESTPYDVQVAVDPEMLGKVFEELVTGRHDTGAYYTPRPIVAFMCREALKGYLTAAVPQLTAEQASSFVDEYRVNDLTIPLAEGILAALKVVTTVDTACGSGAYLLGMMQELLELQRLLYNSALIQDAAELYDLKLQIIERNLYGVDKDETAVGIAMLRLWLSLVIDYNGPGDPPPLPNLTFKILQGDSLLAPEPTSDLLPNMFRALSGRAAKVRRI